MTDYALKTVEFVLDESLFIPGNCLVAAGTLYADVLAIQFKFRFTMVKPLDGPAFQAMTARTIDRSLLFKLPGVHIFMTAGAGSG